MSNLDVDPPPLAPEPQQLTNWCMTMFRRIADLVGSSDISIPTGTSWAFSGPVAPSGWLLEDGSAVSRVTYSSLFSVIGTTYGPGDGSTTFNLPDSRGRTVIGVGTGTYTGATTRTLGANGGEETHVLASTEMPTHSHGVNDPNHSHGVNDPRHNHGVTDPGHKHSVNVTSFSGGGGSVMTEGVPASGTDPNAIFSGTTGVSINTALTGVSTQNSSTGVSTQNSGGGSAHNNMQPFIAKNWIIKI